MITLSAKINLLEGNQQDIIPQLNSNSQNNISNKILNISGWKSNGGNPFLLGASKIGNGETLSNNVNFFIGNSLSSENGVFLEPYLITIQNSNKRIVTLVFDTFNNQFPTSININGNIYENNSSSFLIPTNENLETIVISIDNWNVPFMPLRLQGILVDIDIVIDRKNIISLSSNIKSRKDATLPSWGVKSNSSQARFNDTTGDIIQYIEQGLLKKGIGVEIYLTDTLSGKKTTVGTFKTTEWDYDNDNREITVTYKDELEEWQEIIVPPLIPNIKETTPLLLAEAFDYLYDFTQKMGYKCEKFSFIETPFDNVWVTHLMIEEGNLWNCWNKLCEVAQMYIYTNSFGQVSFHHSSM